MKVKAWVLRQPSFDGRRLVSAEIVEDRVDFDPGRNRLLNFAKECPQVFGPVLLVALADHRSGGDIERSEQVCRPMPDVIRCAALGPSEVHRQNRLSTLKRLDLGLLIDAQDDRIVGRIHVKPDDVAHLLDEEGVLRKPNRLGPMGLKPERAPDPPDRRVAQSDVLRHRARAPVSPTSRRRLQRLRHYRLYCVVRNLASCARPRLVMQAVETIRDEPRSPLSHGAPTRTKLSPHVCVRLSRIGAAQNDLCSERQIPRTPRPRREPLQGCAFLKAQRQDPNLRSSGACHPTLRSCSHHFVDHSLIRETSRTRAVGAGVRLLQQQTPIARTRAARATSCPKTAARRRALSCRPSCCRGWPWRAFRACPASASCRSRDWRRPHPRPSPCPCPCRPSPCARAWG